MTHTVDYFISEYKMLRHTSLLFEGYKKGGGLFCNFPVPTMQSQTAINQQSFPVHFSALPNTLFVHAYTTLAFTSLTILTHTRTSLSPFHITQGNFSFKLWWKLETTLVACSFVVKSSFLNYIFTRDWTLLVWRSLQLTPHRHLGHRLILVGMEQCIDSMV